MILRNIKKSYGDKVIFDNFDIEFEQGKITAILGRSGCGKTTLLNIICGSVEYTGEVERPDKISYIFQSQRLVPNLTVYKNLEYVLSYIRDKNEKNKHIEEVLRMVEMYDERGKYPSQLSGGMAQRVSLARAFVYDAPLMLMDEPFKGLDVSLKKRIIDVFRKLYEGYNRTVVFVTHDIDEALFLADRIIVLEEGGKIVYDKELSVDRADRKAGDFAEIKNEIYGIL